MLMSAWDIVKAAVDLYKKHVHLYLRYTIVLYIPTLVAMTVIYILSTIFGENSMTLFVSAPILFIVSGLVSFWFSLAFIRVIAGTYRGGYTAQPIRDEIEKAKTILWPAIVASLLSGLAILGGFVLLAIPGIIFSMWFAFVLYTVALDGHRKIEALRASKQLVQGRWWGVFWRLLVPGAIYLVISGALQLPFEFLADASQSPIVIGISVIISTLVSLLLTPFITAAQTILYVELQKSPVGVIEPPKPSRRTPKEPPIA